MTEGGGEGVCNHGNNKMAEGGGEVTRTDKNRQEATRTDKNRQETDKNRQETDKNRQETDKNRKSVKKVILTEADEMFTFNEVKGDLFGCPETDCLAHCVSEDLRMGKGIAVEFKKQFGGVGNLAAQEKKTGQVAVLKKGQRFIYYLITKKKATGKPTYESLHASLKELKKHCIQNKVQSLAMPKIGCGLDRLDWDLVAKMIKDLFADTNIHITVYAL